MKKRNLIQKMMAVLLAVLLVMGMAQSAVVSVLARDADSNDIGTTEEGTETELEADDGTEEESVIAMAAGGSITQDGYTWKIPDTMNITVGEEESGGIYGGGESLFSINYSFSSSDSAVAIVDGGGYNDCGFDVTGVSEGTATITFICTYRLSCLSDSETKSVSGSFDVVVTPAKYTLTVNNGTGGGEYEAGATVTITANAAASGQQFDKWEVNSGNVTLADATSSTTTFTMPAGAVEVTAAYKDSVSDADKVAAAKTVVENALAKINPTNDTEREGVQAVIDDALSEAGITDISAVITAWNSLDKATTSHEGKITVRVNVDLKTSDPYSSTEVYQMVKTELVIPKLQDTAQEKYTVTVNNGTGGGEYEAGATVTITANAATSGKQFDRWLVGRGGITLADSTSSTTTFTMPEQMVEVAATYKESVSDADKVAAAKSVVENVLDGITATNATTAEEILGVINTALNNAGITGVTVEIDKFRKYEASTSAEGYIEGVVFITCGQEAKNVNMEKPIAKLTAEKYTVAVNGGTGDGEYAVGDTVTIMANAPASGKQFDKWEVNSGSVTLANATSSTTTFTMPARAVSVTATYKTNTGDGSSTGGGSSGGGSSTGDGNSSGAGKVEKDVQTDGKAPDTQISTPKAELENMLLTDAEKQQVQNGTDITIVLEVKDAGDSVNDSDKAAVQQALSSYTVGQYLNIDLYKLAGQTRTDITETAKKIRIVLTVPDSLKNTDSSKTRKFAVIRVHDGRAELLTDLDDSTGTITIETDRFSTYAVVYKDAANGGNDGNNNDDGSDDDNDGTNDNDNSSNNGGNDNGNNNGSNNNGNNNNSNGDNNHNNSDKKDAKSDSQKDDEPKTGDTAPIELYATLAMVAGFAYLLLYFADRERGMTEETKKELVSRIIRWAKQGGKIRKCLALAAIFVLLAYYHSIGKKTCAEWKEVYGE